MKKILYLLFLPLVLSLTGCSKDDDETKDPGFNPSSILGRWMGTAYMGGKYAHSSLHLFADGTGRLVYCEATSTNPPVAYYEIKYTLDNNIITIDGETLSGKYTVKVSDNKMDFVNEGIKRTIKFSKVTIDDYPIYTYLWKTYVSTDSYVIWDFDAKGTGTLLLPATSQQAAYSKNFTYVHDYENGPMTILYDDGTSRDYFYTVVDSGHFLLFSKETESSDIRYTCLIQHTKK